MKNSDFDINRLPEYKEDNRLEVKKASGGLPHSIWETYSSFANSDGGLIVLGVEEDKKHQLHVVGVTNAEELIRDFWNTVNNQQKISLNILTDKLVYEHHIEDKTIIVIEVPRAEREMRPVYVGKDPMRGTYRRNHDGDFLCTREEVAAMYRDASPVSVDTHVLTEMDFSVFNTDTIRDYRTRFMQLHQNHAWTNLQDEIFLRRIGAVGISSDDHKIHPTIAGLLMFGNEYEIVRVFPGYFLDYQEQMDDTMRWTHRTTSNSGDWSGNLFDFYFRVISRLVSDLNIPFVLNGITRVDNTELHTALREAMLNTLVHADYYGRQGTIVRRTASMIMFSNPGDMRISFRTAVGGGVSDPRNATLMKVFSLIGIGDRAGMGIPDMIDIWQRLTGYTPIYVSQFSPDRTTMSMQIKAIGDKSAINATEKKASTTENEAPTTEKTTEKDMKTTDKILDVIRINPHITNRELAEMFGLTEDGVFFHTKKLRMLGRIRRVKGKKGGHWEIISTDR